MPNKDTAFLWEEEFAPGSLEERERSRSPLGAAAAVRSSGRQPTVRLKNLSKEEVARLTSSILHPTAGPSGRSESGQMASEVEVPVSGATTPASAGPGSRPASRGPGKYWRSCWAEMASETETDTSVAVEEPVLSPRAKKAKKRGRPPTTGQYVGLAQAKAEYLRSKEREVELQAEQELAEDQRRRRNSCLLPQEKTTGEPALVERSLESLSSEELEDSILKAVATIESVRSKSSNLKGQYKRDLRVACEAITGRVRVLRSRNESDEAVKLQAELVAVRAELAAMKKVAEAIPAPMSRDEIGFLVDARLAGLEDRLMPKPRVPVRPPLRADVRNAARAGAAAAAATAADVGEPQAMATSRRPKVSPLPALPPSPPPISPSVGVGLEALESTPVEVTLTGEGGQKKKRRPKKTAAAREAEASRQQRPSVPAPPAPVPPPAKEAWNKVAARKAPRPAKPAVPASPATGAAVAAAKSRRGSGARKLRAPATAAVTLTLQPGAQERGLTYSDVLAQAESSINLKALGINGLRFRTAVTGGRILQVAGDDRAQKADALAANLRELLSEEAVRVARPERCTELRISGLGDAVTSEKVVATLAAEGGCSAAAIKVGEIKRPLGRHGGTAWVRCPVVAAKQLMKGGGHILVGWSEAKLTLLDPRPSRCFRCLEPGHVGVKCAAPDRSALCFRCGQAGHKAAACTSEPSCPACTAEGAVSSHRIGSADCRTASGKAKSKAGGAKPMAHPTKPHTNEEVAMDTAN